MVRFIILLCYTLFISYLHISGKLSNYINMKYSGISTIAIIALSFLTIAEAFRLIEAKRNKNRQIRIIQCDCGHDHGVLMDEETKIDKSGEKVLTLKQCLIYWLLIIPVITGFLYPIATLDSDIVKTKGFSFLFSQENEKDGDFKNQFLRPNSSMYFSDDYYKKANRQRFDILKKQPIIQLKEENYLKDMEVLYNNLSQSKGKQVEFDGFVFDDPTNDEEYIFVLRFGIIHCIADSGVYGFLVKLPIGVHYKNDTWLHIKGTIDEIYYPTVKTNIPIVKASDWKEIKPPKSPYAYMKY